jgi:hypothetical protein
MEDLDDLCQSCNGGKIDGHFGGWSHDDDEGHLW